MVNLIGVFKEHKKTRMVGEDQRVIRDDIRKVIATRPLRVLNIVSRIYIEFSVKLQPSEAFNKGMT